MDNDHIDDRGAFEEKKRSTTKLVVQISAGVLLVVVGLAVIWLMWNPPAKPVEPKQKKRDIHISEVVPAFSVPKLEKPKPPEPKPEPKPIVQKPEPKLEKPAPPPVDKNMVMKWIKEAKPEKEDPDLLRRLNSGLNDIPAEKKKKENLASPDLSKLQLAAKVDPNIDLSVTETPIVQASMLPDLKWLVPKGTSIPLAMETAIQSNQSGFIKGVLSEDVYSADGTIKLLDKGSVATGEYMSRTIAYGKERVFAIWDRIRTPQGVVINIASPATDALGRAGLGGFIDNHYFERFGTAILISIISDSFNRGSTENYENTNDALENVTATILEEYSKIKPTLHTWQGARTNIYVARDLDLSNVYDLEKNPELRDYYRSLEN